jgi:hypothetical protein
MVGSAKQLLELIRIAERLITANAIVDTGSGSRYFVAHALHDMWGSFRLRILLPDAHFPINYPPLRATGVSAVGDPGHHEPRATAAELKFESIHTD